MIAARLAAPADFEGWRREARRLAAARIAPDAVAWLVGEEQGGLFEAALEEAGAQQGASGAGLTVPRRFIELAETVICHREPERFGLLYRLLLRLQAEPGLLDVARAGGGGGGGSGAHSTLAPEALMIFAQSWTSWATNFANAAGGMSTVVAASTRMRSW